MVMTPWGNAAELRSRRLRPGPGTERETVEANQRERLMAGMVAAIDEHGYETTRVADVVRISGVSRSAFYDYFDDKLDCFLATADAIAELAVGQIAAAFESADGWDESLRAATDKFLELVQSQPAAARLCLVEIYAAGPEAVKRLDAATLAVERVVSRAFEQSPERAGMPRDVVRAIVGGINKAVHSRLRRRELDDLSTVVPQLFDWGMGYHAPPQPLRRPRRRPSRGAAPKRSSDKPRERLIHAITETVAAKGYGITTIAEIADHAKASLSTFYQHFPTKQDAFRVAVQQAQADAIAATLPAFQEAPDWQSGVRDGLDAMFGFLAAEPAAASIGAVDVLGAGAEGLAAGDNAIDAIHFFLAPGYEQAPDAGPIVGEAVGAAIYTLVYSQIRQRRVERMRELAPTAAFVALAPFVGAEAAGAVANAR